MPGPPSGPQASVKHCPTCKGEVFPVASIKQRAANSHKYECKDCGRKFEINALDPKHDGDRIDPALDRLGLKAIDDLTFQVTLPVPASREHR